MKNSFLFILAWTLLFSCSSALQKTVSEFPAEDKDIQSSPLGEDRVPPKNLDYLRPEEIHWRWSGSSSGTKEKTSDNNVAPDQKPDQKESMETKQTLTNTVEKKIDEKESPSSNDTAAGTPVNSVLSETEIRHDVDKETDALQKEEEHVALEKTVAQTEKPEHDKYYVQVGAWKNPGLAETMLKNIKKFYPKAYITVENNLHKVRVPGGQTKDEGTRISKDIEKKFPIKAFVALNPQ